MEQFDSMLSPIIDQTLGQRCRSIIGYQYSEIIRSLMSVYLLILNLERTLFIRHQNGCLTKNCY